MNRFSSLAIMLTLSTIFLIGGCPKNKPVIGFGTGTMNLDEWVQIPVRYQEQGSFPEQVSQGGNGICDVTFDFAYPIASVEGNKIPDVGNTPAGCVATLDAGGGTGTFSLSCTSALPSTLTTLADVTFFSNDSSVLDPGVITTSNRFATECPPPAAATATVAMIPAGQLLGAAAVGPASAGIHVEFDDTTSPSCGTGCSFPSTLRYSEDVAEGDVCRVQGDIEYQALTADGDFFQSIAGTPSNPFPGCLAGLGSPTTPDSGGRATVNFDLDCFGFPTEIPLPQNAALMDVTFFGSSDSVAGTFPVQIINLTLSPCTGGSVGQAPLGESADFTMVVP